MDECKTLNEGCAWEGPQSKRAAHEAGCAVLRLWHRLSYSLSRFASERQLHADLTVATAGNEVGRCK